MNSTTRPMMRVCLAGCWWSIGSCDLYPFVTRESRVRGAELFRIGSPLQPEPQVEIADPASSAAASESDDVVPANRRRRMDSEEEEEEEEENDDESAASSDGETRTPSNIDMMVKKLVRLALASEYSRLPIRRTDISAKVLGEQGSRQFKTVFDQAQRVLRSRFGMQMVELPGKEKVTISQRRAAQRVEKPSTTSNKSWILTSTLPAPYRSPEILPPTKAPSSFSDSTYTAIYTFLISVITLSGGSIAEQKLERYLKRTNIDMYTPIDRTDRLIQRLCKDGYLVRNRETDGGEEVIEYMVGPRGKIEVGESGVAGLVREVYGRPDPTTTGEARNGTQENEEEDEFERRLERSLAASRRERARGADTGDEPPDEGRANRRSQLNRRNTRGRAARDDEDYDE
ncbi:hypothetical protein T310_0488 [Rasamsonia emersonii CBS 393.64]|uniref:MAGE domain-containing protein n=1 Tax=Rasamsonia emersonii (strain ATCC 16479 / CBS 393.64 / IMI 116815) TaxID=1408163 RepID=A0A0F4Z4K6_RASE3|nr:hypothetical protein T310_0488 [Rasamsonia emersonii CBS 393.64]KKA25464.1 hypothetical protein T310_0488 [Rasamsonia emersonii CBS 393.64]